MTVRLLERADVSWRTWVFLQVLKRLASKLTLAKATNLKGSPPLTPKASQVKGCQVVARVVDEMHVYDIIPDDKDNDGQAETIGTNRRRVFYLPGGGFIMATQFFHWSYCAALARNSPNTVVTLISYPLAPQHSAPDTFDKIQKCLQTLFAEARGNEEEIVLVGSSAGANLILGMTLDWMARQPVSNEEPDSSVNPPILPRVLLAICPIVDFHHAHQESERVEKVDHILSNGFIRQVTKLWAGTWSFDDSRISPIKGDLTLFVKYGIEVHGIIAGADILAPDAELFVRKCQEMGVDGQWLKWDGQPHCFPLGTWGGFSEAEFALEWVVKVLTNEK